MASNAHWCIKSVDKKNVSVGCKAKWVKNGHTRTGKQRYRCRHCGKTMLVEYTNNACSQGIDADIIKLTKEGMGIRSTARYLRISTTTLLKRIVLIANRLTMPMISIGKIYEVDELRTFIKRKGRPIWIVCAYERESRRIVSFCIGNRTNSTLNVVLKTLKLANASKIFTDGLKNYRYLINKNVHRVEQYATNHIERFNLTLRTHLKRLNRRTICFSRSITMLNAVLKIYLWSY